MSGMAYLDNSSTTKPSKKCIAAITDAFEFNWGNPSSLHILGLNAENALNSARDIIAEHLNCRDDEIYFTSGGTEGNNTAILGAARRRRGRGNKIVTSAIEHPSVLEAMKLLEAEGFEIIYLKPDKSGNISKEDIFDAIDNKTVLVSLMLVNNETGAILPVGYASEVIRQKNAPALLHCDAVQGFGKMDTDPKKLGVDLMSISAHKVHGPKGIGALYIKKGVTISPLLLGGAQEKGMRSGTENVPLCLGFAAAVGELKGINSALKEIGELNSYARIRLTKEGLCEINSASDALPYILNISVLGYRSETLLHFLENKNIFVSSGSACAKGEGSYVLKAMGLCKAHIDSALRLSFSRYTKKEEIDSLVVALSEAKERLRKAKI